MMIDINFALLIETIVAVLLFITIFYCMMLNTRLKRLRANESGMRSLVVELLQATEIAEKAIHGLRNTAQDCDKILVDRLAQAQTQEADLQKTVEAGQQMMHRLAQIAQLGKELDKKPVSAQRSIRVESEHMPAQLSELERAAQAVKARLMRKQQQALAV